MRFDDLYRLAVEQGMDADPRGREEVEKGLQRSRQEYDRLTGQEQAEFDIERLTNPYSDTRILTGDGNLEVERILVGIDIEMGELLLADRLRQQGQRIDLVMSHHPEGKALAALHDVMHLQEDVLHSLGVPINVAEGLLAGRIKEVHRNLLPVNHNRAVDGARLLGLALLSVHTPADNMVVNFLTQYLQKKAINTVGDIVTALKELPEYEAAVKLNAGPAIVLGDKKRRAGKIFVDMTGGTSGAEDSYSRLVEAGVGTIVCMHISDKHRQKAEKQHLNVVIAGHMASDSLGLNLLVDELQRRGVEVVPCAGFTRFSR